MWLFCHSLIYDMSWDSWGSYSLRKKKVGASTERWFFSFLVLIRLLSLPMLFIALTHQILHTNIGRREASKMPQQFWLRRKFWRDIYFAGEAGAAVFKETLENMSALTFSFWSREFNNLWLVSGHLDTKPPHNQRNHHHVQGWIQHFSWLVSTKMNFSMRLEIEGRSHELARGVRGHASPEKFWNLDDL